MASDDKQRIQAKYEQVIGPIREAARRCGYAIAVHGSIARDIDLVAIPWTAEAVDDETLAQAVAQAAFRAGDEWAECGAISRADKPHGRVAWVVHLEGQTYLDLSVMPRGIQ